MNHTYKAYTKSNDEYCIQHFGIKGQKWGTRNYESYDGKLTPAGKERYYGGSNDSSNKKSEKKKETDSRQNNTEKDKINFKDAISSYTSALNLITKLGGTSIATVTLTALGVGGYYAGKKLKSFLNKKKSMKVSEVIDNN